MQEITVQSTGDEERIFTKKEYLKKEGGLRCYRDRSSNLQSYQTCEEGGEGLITEGERKEWFFAVICFQNRENVTFLTAFMFVLQDSGKVQCC